MKSIRIKNRRIGQGEPLYLIAEMACAHDGEMEKALRLVDSAVRSGADAVQLQFFVTDELVTPDHPVHDTLKKVEFSFNEWKEIYKYARQSPIDVFACVFDVPSARLAIALEVDGIKLNSSDLMNPELLEIVAKSGIPFTLGTGASEINDIALALQHAEASGAKNLVIMHGVQNFPTEINNAHIWKVRLLDGLFPYPVGYADHTDASLELAKTVDLIAVGAGAVILEKHITLNRDERGVDYQAALEPHEIKSWITLVRDSERARGATKILALRDSDHEYRRFQKKSIVARRNLKTGDKLMVTDLQFLRCAGDPGLSPMDMEKVLHHRLLRDIDRYKKIHLTDIEQ